MSAIKVQLYKIEAGVPDPTINWDYRGHGGQVGFKDTHRTLRNVGPLKFEWDPATPEMVAFIEREGGTLNKWLASLALMDDLGSLDFDVPLPLADLVGEWSLRVCLMDD